MSAIINVQKAFERPVTQSDVRLTQLRQKDVSYPTNTQYQHGPSGLLNQPGVDPNVISTIYRPRGISRYIPFRATTNVTPLFKMLTSQAADSGSDPADACARGKTAGKLTEMQHTAVFGLLKRSTETVSLDRIGQVINRAEPMDLTLVNSPVASSPWVPAAARNLQLNDELRMQYWRLGMSIDRFMEGEAFTGSGTNQGGTSGYRGIYGLDTLINTGKTDAITHGLVPAADSTIINWNSNLISASVNVQGVVQDIVSMMGRLMKFMEAKADSTGMSPVRWAYAMRPDLFWELTAIWPCSYLTNGCSVPSGATQFVGANDQIAMRDGMRTGNYLWINSVQVPVILVDTNTETAAAAGAKSDIYLLPLSAGGMSTLYWEYFDFSNPSALAVAADMPAGEFSITDNGMYAWTFDRTSFCVYFENMVQARLVLRTAFLAARITNVVYPSSLHIFDAQPSGIYFQPGGGSTVGSYTGGVYSPIASTDI